MHALFGDTYASPYCISDKHTLSRSLHTQLIVLSLLNSCTRYPLMLANGTCIHVCLHKVSIYLHTAGAAYICTVL